MAQGFIISSLKAISADNENGIVAEFEKDGDSVRLLRGDASIVRAVLRDDLRCGPPGRCVPGTMRDSDGGESPVLVRVAAYTDTPELRFFGGVQATPHRCIGEDLYLVAGGAGGGDPRAGTELEHEIGPQNPSDPAFTARMRLHQSWYRARVLHAPVGKGPRPGSDRLLGNMLTKDDADVGLNFVSNEAFMEARRRAQADVGMVERYRLFHNMLSSQPMCFNLFAALVHDKRMATAFLNRALGGDSHGGDPRSGPPSRVQEVLDVQFEYAPEPRCEYLDDHTAFDAFFKVRCADGSLGFVGVETKLTEPFSSGTPDKEAYRRWMKPGPRSPWQTDAHDKVNLPGQNQLWRDHLLAIAMRDHASSEYRHGCLVLVRHPEDDHCKKIADRYRETLVPGDPSFVEITLGDAVDALGQRSAPGYSCGWLDNLHRRYLALDESEALWKTAKAESQTR